MNALRSIFGIAVILGVVTAGCDSGPKPGDVMTVNGLPMVYIPGGTFTLGDSSIGTIQVRLEPYLISLTEVRNADFRDFARLFDLPFRIPTTHDDHPVTNVTWETADAYAAWRGMRLPTEAEWELAAAGTEGRRYPWGDRWDPTLLNANDEATGFLPPDGSIDGYPYLAPVGLFADGASVYGVLDMAGNVWEWTADWYADYPALVGTVHDWRGPSEGAHKVMRGGSYSTNRLNTRTFHRAYLPPNARRPDVGIRLVSDYPPQKPGEMPREAIGQREIDAHFDDIAK